MTQQFSALCAWCDYVVDMASQVTDAKDRAEQKEEARMKPGDATMCIACGQMNIICDDDTFRKPTEEEAKVLDDDKRVQALRKAWANVMAGR